MEVFTLFALVCAFPIILMGAVSWLMNWEQEQELRRQERRARRRRGAATPEDVLEEARRWAERDER